MILFSLKVDGLMPTCDFFRACIPGTASARHSWKQHGESRALAVVASTEPQLTADLVCKRSNILMSSPLLTSGSNPSGKAGPSLETESA